MFQLVAAAIRCMAERLDESALIALSIALEEKVANVLCNQLIEQSSGRERR